MKKFNLLIATLSFGVSPLAFCMKADIKHAIKKWQHTSSDSAIEKCLDHAINVGQRKHKKKAIKQLPAQSTAKELEDNSSQEFISDWETYLLLLSGIKHHLSVCDKNYIEQLDNDYTCYYCDMRTNELTKHVYTMQHKHPAHIRVFLPKFDINKMINNAKKNLNLLCTGAKKLP